MISLPRLINDRPWRSWIIFLALVLAVFLPSLGTSPVVWQDEVQFVDWGRVMLDPHTDWAVTWSAHKHQPLPPISYLGCIGEELAFRLTGTVLGPRLFCIAGGFALGTLVLILLTPQRRPTLMTCLFAALIVLDPVLMQCYRAGRLDVMAMAFVLAGALCTQRYARRQDWRWLAVAALALGCAPYVWIRSVMALPAALLPLIFVPGIPDRKLVRAVLALVALTAVAGLLFLPPAWPGLQGARALSNSPVYLFRDLAGNGGLKSPSIIILQMLDDVLRCLFLAIPLMLLAAMGLFAAFLGPNLNLLRKILAALVIAATLIFQFKFTTDLHHFTALYWVPLLVVFAWQGMERLAFAGYTRRARWLTTGMALLLATHAFFTADNSYNAWLDRDSFGPDALQPVVKALPVANRRLIVDDFRLYFLLRHSGFQPFYLFTDLDRAAPQFRFYAPRAYSDYQPFYLFSNAAAEPLPNLLVGGRPSTWAIWAASFETQLRHPLVKQLPLGYRLVTPGSK